MTRGLAPLPETLPVPDANAVYSEIADLRTMGAAIVKGYPDTDKRWMNSPVFSETVRCETCGGYFDAVIIVLP